MAALDSCLSRSSPEHLFHVVFILPTFSPFYRIVWSAGSITSAVKLAKKAAGFSSKIEVECRSIEEANEAASAGCDIGEGVSNSALNAIDFPSKLLHSFI